jgi:hypothetical protein
MAYMQGLGTANASVSIGLYIIGFAVVLAVLAALPGPPRR